MATILERRQTQRLAIWNGAIWAVGNGLAGSTLIFYLARELHAERFGLGIGAILAAPHIVGLLRLGAPAMVERLADRKRFCLSTFSVSAALLLMLPWISAPGALPSPGWSLAALVALWCFYHLFQYLGTVALWAWLADAAPTRIRGRYFGRRQRWMSAGTAASALTTGFFIWLVHEMNPDCAKWIPYGVAAALGAICMFAALWPMFLMPSCDHRLKNRGEKKPVPGDRVSGGLAFRVKWTTPFRDRRFWPLLAFGCWFSFFNGITQAAQHAFSMNVLHVSLLLSLTLQTGMNAGQWSVSPWLGRLADRLGNRVVMIVSQLCVAAGMLFFAIATPAEWWWIIWAWMFWIAYAGLNVCLPNLTLKLAPPGGHASYVAAFYAVTGIFYAANTIVGGLLVDSFQNRTFSLGCVTIAFFPAIFAFGWLMRSLGAALLLGVVEPPRNTD